MFKSLFNLKLFYLFTVSIVFWYSIIRSKLQIGVLNPFYKMYQIDLFFEYDVYSIHLFNYFGLLHFCLWGLIISLYFKPDSLLRVKDLFVMLLLILIIIFSFFLVPNLELASNYSVTFEYECGGFLLKQCLHDEGVCIFCIKKMNSHEFWVWGKFKIYFYLFLLIIYNLIERFIFYIYHT